MPASFRTILKVSLPFLLDANVPFESDYVGWKIPGGTSETTDNFTVWPLHHNSVDTRQRNQPEQEKMLVGDIEFVKGIDDTIVPAFVRLYIGNDQFKKRGITSGVYRNAVQGTFKFLPTGINGKLGAIKVCGWNVLHEDAHPCEIESSFEIMDCIPGNQGHVIGSFSEFWNRMYQVLMASIAILHDCRSVVLFQSGDSRFQIRYVFIGPLDFQTGISEEFAH